MNQIKKSYLTPGHATYMTSPQFTYKYYDKKIPLEKIKKILHSIETYTLYKQRHKKINRNPTYLYETRKLVEVDLIEMGRFYRVNKGVKFLLMAIDAYSRKLWVAPIKSKSATEFLRGFKEVLEQMGTKPKRICSDLEGAVLSGIFQDFCRQQGIEISHPKNIQHCVHIERYGVGVF